MRELSLTEKREVKAAGISGALVSAVGGIVKEGLHFVNDLFANIVSTVFLFQHTNDYDKLEMKIGNNTIKYDRTSQTKAVPAAPVYPVPDSLI